MFIVKYIKYRSQKLPGAETDGRDTGYFTHHKEIITEQYPDNRDTLKLPERFKGEVVDAH